VRNIPFRGFSLMACVMLVARPVGALTPMLPHDVINGCFQLKATSIELTEEGARGLSALTELISRRPERIMAANVTVARPWPSPGSSERLFLSDVNYQSFITTKPDTGGRTEGRVYAAAEASVLAAALLPNELAAIHGIGFSEMRSSETSRCGMEVIVLAALNDLPGPFFSFDCDAQGCRKVKTL
jgi:hypothetical protein